MSLAASVRRCVTCGELAELSDTDVRLCRRVRYGYFPSRFRLAPAMALLPVLCNGLLVPAEERRAFAVDSRAGRVIAGTDPKEVA